MTLNQKYKLSKSKLPFKDWVLEQQLNSKLDFDDNKFNADSGDSEISFGGVPLKYIGVGLVLVIGLLIVIPKLKK